MAGTLRSAGCVRRRRHGGAAAYATILAQCARPRAASLAGCLLLFVPPPLTAQTGPAHVARYTVDDGLSTNYVTALAQDRTGYIWVGTVRGLQRFDGYTFLPYSAISADAPAELSRIITDLRVDRHDRLWVTTPNATWFGRVGQRLRRLDVPGRLAPDSAGRLWFIGEGRVGSIDWQSESPRIAALATDSLPPCCTALATSRAGALWGSSADSGVIRVDLTSGRVDRYALERLMSVVAVVEDADGRIWVGGSNGVEVLDPGATALRALPAFRDREVGDIEADGRGGFLIPTDLWLARVDRSGAIRERWGPRAAYGDGPVLARNLMVDREDGIWLATGASGVYRFDLTPPLFEHVAPTAADIGAPSGFVMALHEQPDSTLWIASLGAGAYALADRWRLVGEFRNDPAPGLGSHNNVWDFEQDAAGNLWMGTNDGLCLMPVMACYPAPGPAPVADITAAPDGWFWFAHASRGGGSFHPGTRQYGESVPLGEWMITAYIDPQRNELWLGGNGLFRARVANGRVLEPPRPVTAEVAADEQVFDIRRDSRGVLWLGSHNGLQRWDSLSQRFFVLDVPELRGTTVFSITEDDDGRLWLGTTHGLVHYSPISGAARRYRRQDGVLSGEFNRRAALRRHNGELVLGGLQGLTVFRPERVSAPRQPPPLVFTRWQKVTADGPVEGHTDGSTPLRLGPGDRAFTLEFAALTFAAGPVRSYRYRLDGLNADWIETSDHAVTYATPPPGRYSFRVQAAAGSEGAWGEPGATLALLVVPPFHGTAAFRALLMAALLGALWLLHRLRLRQALATERLRLRISRDLHDEIGAGLSSIALLSDAVSAHDAIDARQRSQLARIGHSARDMVADLRDIVWAIDPDGDRLHDVVARMQDVAGDLLRDVRVSFRAPAATELSARIGMATRRDLLLIYKEILHNIARHARAGAVDVQLTTQRDTVELVITDDGVGFDPATVRTGTGLKSMNGRALQLGGRLDLTSTPGAGTTVRLTVRTT